jgi:DNA-binding HxlR family transcriptional regulator
MMSSTRPFGAVARILGRRWTLELLCYLQERRRFCELEQLVGRINTETLSSWECHLQEGGRWL